MIEVAVRRLIQSILTMLVLTIAVFLLLRLAPGDPARAVLPPGAPESMVAEMRRFLKLDRPLYVQYVSWLGNAIRGDLGTSLQSRQPVGEMIRQRLPQTIQLALLVMLVSSTLGVVLGILSALRPGSLIDYLVRILSLAGFAMPGFWLAIMLILLFAVTWGILPTSGYGSPKHFVLPTITLVAHLAGILASMVAATVKEVLQEDYVRTARAKGLAERVVLRRHVLRNSFIVLITLIGLQLGSLLGGAVIVETVFVWPGIGRLTIDAVGYRDYPVIQAMALIAGVSFIVVNLVVDLLYAVIDPRIRYK